MGNNNRKNKQSKWPFFLSISLIAIAIASYFLFSDYQKFIDNAYEVLTSGNEPGISAWVDSFGWAGPVLIIILMVLQMFLLVIPSPLLMVISIIAYGPVWGTVLSIAAIGAASTVGYWIGRYLGIMAVDKLIGQKKEEKVTQYMERYGIWAIIIARLTPILSNDAISLVGGILKMGYWKFIGATLAGIAPLTILIAYFGENSERLKSGLIWTSIISVALFIGYIIYDRNRKKER